MASPGAQAPVALAGRPGRLKGALDLDAVQADLVHVIQRALEPAHVSMWTNNRG